MFKGLSIILVVFLIIGILHFVTLRLLKLSKKKKRQFRKVFWYLYGLVFIVQGVLRMIELQAHSLLSLLMILCGLAVIILNFTGKIDPPEKPS